MGKKNVGNTVSKIIAIEYRIINFFMANKNECYNKTILIKELQVSRNTIDNILSFFLQMNMVDEHIISGKKYYRINKDFLFLQELYENNNQFNHLGKNNKNI